MVSGVSTAGELGCPGNPVYNDVPRSDYSLATSLPTSVQDATAGTGAGAVLARHEVIFIFSLLVAMPYFLPSACVASWALPWVRSSPQPVIKPRRC